MSNGTENNGNSDRMRLVVELPPYTTEKIEDMLAKTGMTRTQLVIMMVDKVHASVVGERAA